MILSENFKARVLHYVGRCIDLNGILAKRFDRDMYIDVRLSHCSLTVECYEYEWSKGADEDTPPATVWKRHVHFMKSHTECEREFAELDKTLLETYWGDQEHD